MSSPVDDVFLDDEDDEMPKRRKKQVMFDDEDEDGAVGSGGESESETKKRDRDGEDDEETQRRKQRKREKREKKAEQEERRRLREERRQKMAERQQDDDEDDGPRNKFLDDIADVADSDEDEDYDEDMGDFLADEGEEAAQLAAEVSGPRPPIPDIPDDRPRNARARRLYGNLEDMERRFQEQADLGEEDLDDMGEEMASTVGEAAPVGKVLPDVTDAKLFMVKCMEAGKEPQQNIATAHKMVAMYLRGEADRKAPPVLSVYCQPHLKGWVYVEAYKEAQVVEFVRSFRPLAHYSVKMVPLTEMETTMDASLRQIQGAQTTFKNGDWVKVRGHFGVYKGDIARIVIIHNDKAKVQLVPRSWAGARPSERVKTGAKPPRRFVSSEHTIGSNTWEEGYVVFDVALNRLEKIKPDMGEVSFFNKGQLARQKTGKRVMQKAQNQIQFFVDDMVRVIHGDMKNMKGRILTIASEEQERRIAVKPVTEEKALARIKSLDFQPHQLAKFFEAGDHVKCISGTQIGKTGMVCKIQDSTRKNGAPIAVILADITLVEFKTSVNSLQISKDIATGQNTAGGIYQVGQLVQLINSASVGVIVGIEHGEKLRVLTREGRSHIFGLSEIKARDRMMTSRTQAKVSGDGRTATVSQESVVKVCKGPWKNRIGVVGSISGQHIWIKLHDRLEDCGYICVATSMVALQAHGVRTLEQGTGKDGGADFLNKKLKLKLSKRKGETVVILQGSYKGLYGTIREENEDTVKVALNTKPKVVTLDKTTVSFLDEAGGLNRLSNEPDEIKEFQHLKYGRTPVMERTPAGSTTMHEFATHASAWGTGSGTTPRTRARKSAAVAVPNLAMSDNYRFGATPVDLGDDYSPIGDATGTRRTGGSFTKGSRLDQTGTLVSAGSDMSRGVTAGMTGALSGGLSDIHGGLTPMDQFSPALTGLDTNREGLTPSDNFTGTYTGRDYTQSGTFTDGTGPGTGTGTNNRSHGNPSQSGRGTGTYTVGTGDYTGGDFTSGYTRRDNTGTATPGFTARDNTAGQTPIGTAYTAGDYTDEGNYTVGERDYTAGEYTAGNTRARGNNTEYTPHGTDLYDPATEGDYVRGDSDHGLSDHEGTGGDQTVQDNWLSPDQDPGTDGEFGDDIDEDKI